jgi:hypothetical protein
MAYTAPKSVTTYIYIYIYRERERERERDILLIFRNTYKAKFKILVKFGKLSQVTH